MTKQPEYLQCLLVEMDSIASLLFYRYDSTTGIFTVPPGGDGLYYFFLYLTTISTEFAYFDITVNSEILCLAIADLSQANSGDVWGTSCSGITEVMEGKFVAYL